MSNNWNQACSMAKKPTKPWAPMPMYRTYKGTMTMLTTVM